MSEISSVSPAWANASQLLQVAYTYKCRGQPSPTRGPNPARGLGGASARQLVYLVKEQICQISSLSHVKRRSLRLLLKTDAQQQEAAEEQISSEMESANADDP